MTTPAAPQEFYFPDYAARRISGDFQPMDLLPAVNSNTHSTQGTSAKISSPPIHCSQTILTQTGRRKSHPKFPSKMVPSRSRTMPILAKDTDVVLDAAPLWLELTSGQTFATVPDDTTYSKESDSPVQHHQMPLQPIRRANSSKPTVTSRIKAAKAGTHGRGVFVVWVICCFMFLVVVPLICIVLGITLHTPDLEYTPTVKSFPGRTLWLTLGLVSADPLQSVVTFDWLVMYEENTSCSNTTLSMCNNINIFVDNNLLAGNTNSLQLSNDIPTAPIFRLNETTAVLSDQRSNIPLFRTDFLAISRTHGGTRLSLVNYPFDSYLAQIIMFAEDTNNEMVALRITSSYGNAVGFSTTILDCETQNIDVPPGMLCIEVTIKRGFLVRTFCVLVVIAIWLITLVLLLLTLTSVIFGFRQRVEVLVVPVATIFAFTQLRSSMPGAPEGFGDILDFVGFLPCLAILSFSAALSLGAFLLADPTEKPEILTWGRLRDELSIRSKVSTDNAAEKEIDEEESANVGV